jgi:hypothetical protein
MDCMNIGKMPLHCIIENGMYLEIAYDVLFDRDAPQKGLKSHEFNSSIICYSAHL